MERITETKSITNYKNNANNKILESNIYKINLEKDEYELNMILFDSNIIQFKLLQKNNIPFSYYIEEYDLENIKKKLFVFFNEMKEVYQFYNKVLLKNKVKLIFIKEENKMCLNFTNIINLDEEVETNLELKEIKLSQEEVFKVLVKEVIELKNKQNKNNNDNMNNPKIIEEINKENNEKIKNFEQKILNLEEKINKIITEYDKKKNKEIEEEKNKNQEKIKNLEEKIIKLEEKINEIKNKYEEKINEIIKEYDERKNKEIEEENNKKEEEKLFTLNDNVNLINNFKFENGDKLKNINVISNDLNITFLKSVAVYSIIKNNETLYEIAYPDNKNGFNIIIYNIILNKIQNKISNAHSNNIHKIKHYYDKNKKYHILLSSSADKSIKLWNISSNPISNILTINNCFDGDNYSPFCLMFKEEMFYICGGSRTEKKKIWSQNGNLIGNIEKSNLNYGCFIETTYINNKIYILLCGNYHSECLDYDDNTIKTYKHNKNNFNSRQDIINLFKKNEIIYLISGDNSGFIYIFDFMTTNLIKEIKLEGTVYSICSLNEKNLIASSNKLLCIIDMDKYSISGKYSGHDNTIMGIKKIRIPDKGEYIISYDSKSIKIWK